MAENKLIRTATGKEFAEAWDGVSTIDGILRISIVGSTLDELHAVFRDPAETVTLTRIWDGQESVYTGYTNYMGVTRNMAGEMIVGLSPKEG